MATGTDSRFAAIHEDFLSCKICFEELNQPKSLPCLHTFCLKCLENHATRNRRGRNRFSCPICRKNCNIPGKGVQDFPTNFMIQGLKDVVQGPPAEKNKSEFLMCQNHPSVKSNWFCYPCCKSICQKCMMECHNGIHCDCRKGTPTVSELHNFQQKKLATLQGNLVRWNSDCKEKAAQLSDIQASKQALKEEADRVFSKIEKKLNEDKRSIHEDIDQRFGTDTELNECLSTLKKFEEYMNTTKIALPQITGPELTVKGLENYQKSHKDLNFKSFDLECTYFEVKDLVFQSPPQTRLEVSEDVITAVMEKPLAMLQTGIDSENIKCSLIGEFSIKICGDHEASLRELLFARGNLYVLDSRSTDIKIFDTRGQFISTFHDRYNHDTPWSFCCLPNDTIAVSYEQQEIIKVFDLNGNFRKKINIGCPRAMIAVLPDGNIAVCKQRGGYIDIFTQNFQWIKEKRMNHSLSPLYVCGNDEGMLFSDGESLYTYNYQRNFVLKLSESVAKFNPSGMCFDMFGNLLVTSTNYSKIHLFSEYQESQRFQAERVLLDQKYDKLHQPIDVCFSSMDNEIYVGQTNGKIKIFSYDVENISYDVENIFIF